MISAPDASAPVPRPPGNVAEIVLEPNAETILLGQARYVLKNLDVERPGCGYGKLADGCEFAIETLSRLSAATVDAVAAERQRCAIVALEQRCERGTPWDLACTTIANAIVPGIVNHAPRRDVGQQQDSGADQ